MALQIRDAAPAEHDSLLDLVMAAYGEFGRFLSPEFGAGFRNDVRGLMGDPRTQVIVAELDSTPAGTITFYPDGRAYDEGLAEGWACLRTLAVLPGARGRGVGRALMDECLTRARELGRTRMLLHTLEFMAAAIALHESLGFRREPALDAGGDDLTFLAYVLKL